MQEDVRQFGLPVRIGGIVDVAQRQGHRVPDVFVDHVAVLDTRQILRRGDRSIVVRGMHGLTRVRRDAQTDRFPAAGVVIVLVGQVDRRQSEFESIEPVARLVVLYQHVFVQRAIQCCRHFIVHAGCGGGDLGPSCRVGIVLELQVDAGFIASLVLVELIGDADHITGRGDRQRLLLRRAEVLE